MQWMAVMHPRLFVLPVPGRIGGVHRVQSDAVFHPHPRINALDNIAINTERRTQVCWHGCSFPLPPGYR
jgi:hypothetical protein